MNARLAALVVALCASVQFSRAEPRDSVALLLSTNGTVEYQRAGNSSWLRAKPGMLLAARDTLRTSQGTARFAFCPDMSVQTLLAMQTLQLPRKDLAQVALDQLAERSTVTSCDLPEQPETDGTMARGGTDIDLSNDCAATTADIDLLETLSRATRAAKDRDVNSATSLYRQASCFEGAAWSRGVIAHLNATRPSGNLNALKGETYALLIGISSYPRETPQGSLQFAHADAQSFADFLIHRKAGALKPDHIRLLTNDQATLAAIEQAVATFVRDARRPENTLIILLAGHGDYLPTKADPQTGKSIELAPFFLTYDTYSQEKKTTALAMSRFRDIIAEETLSFRRVLAYVDVCHAGHVEEAHERDLPDAVHKVFFDNRGLLGLMMASSSRGVAFESDHFGTGHGAFTYALLEGLNGAVAANAQNQIAFDDLYNHVFSRVRYLTNNAQTPGQLDLRFHPIALEEAASEPAIELGPATPMPEGQTGHRERGKPTPPQVKPPPPISPESSIDRLIDDDPLRAVAQLRASPLDASDRQDRSERLRIALEDRGQRILIRYLRGEQDPPRQNDFEKCGLYFEAALRLAPLNAFDESRMLFCQGRAAIFARTAASYSRGIERLEASILLDPERAYAYNALGIAYLEQARGNPANYDRAIHAFEDAIRFAPQWAYALHNLALTYSELGDYLAASRSYLRAMRLAPNYSYLPFNLGLLNQNVNRMEEAERYYRIALEACQRARQLGIEPATPRWRERAVIWNAIATLDMARHRYRQAAAELALAQQDDSELPSRKHNQALLLTLKGESPLAEQLWREAIEADPPAIVSRLALAEYLARTHRDAEARSEYEKLLGKDPHQIEARRQLAKLDFAAGKPEAAFEHLQFLKEHGLADASFLEEFGDAAARLSHIAEAVEAYDAAIRAARSRKDQERIRKKRVLLAAQ